MSSLGVQQEDASADATDIQTPQYTSGIINSGSNGSGAVAITTAAGDADSAAEAIGHNDSNQGPALGRLIAAAAAGRATHQQPTSMPQQQIKERMDKVVLARRTNIPWRAASAAHGEPGWQRASGTVLLQALQERDPRAYHLYLSTPPGAL